MKFLTPVFASAGSTFTIIKTATSPDMYVQISAGRYKIHDLDTWYRWGFNWGMVHLLSDAELGSIPQGPDITQAVRPFGSSTVYVIENQVTRAVPTPDALLLSGYSFSQVSDIMPEIINQLNRGSDLTIPSVIRSPSDGAMYVLWGGQKHHITNIDVYNQWGFVGYSESNYINTLPSGVPLTKLIRVNGGPTVWVVDNQTRRPLPSPEALTLNNNSWNDVVDIDPTLLQTLREGDVYYAPTTVRLPGSSQYYFFFQNTLHPVVDTDTFTAWGFDTLGSTITAAANNYPVGSSVTRLVRTEEGTVWRITAKQAKAIPSMGVFTGYGFNWSNVTNLPRASYNGILINAGVLDYTTTELQGYTIPATTGIVGLEQHLYTTLGDANSADHYNMTGVPLTGGFLTCAVGSPGCIRDGVAGSGSFGVLDPAVEKYYITMRWNYCNWIENTTLNSFGQPGTMCQSLNSADKSWHKNKKIIVTNPLNGRKLVAAVGDSGPAIWVTRQQGVVSGLSPEGIDYLQAKHNSGGDSLQYGWAVDQTLPLGPFTW